MFTPAPPRTASRRRLSALALASLLLNLLPAATPRAAAAPARVQAAAGPFVRVLNLPTNDIVYDKQTQKLFASVPSTAGASGNSITEIDPAAGSVGPSVFVGSEPNRLALSDDGQALYVGLDGAASFRRFDVPTRTPGLQVPLGGDSFSGPYAVGDLAVSPASRDTVAVARLRPGVSPPGGGVVVYDNGVRRTNASPDFNSISFITFSAAEATLYGLPSFGGNLFTLAVDAAGVSVAGQTSFSAGGGDIQFAGGRVYTATGRVIDPAAGTLVGTFTGVSGPFVVDVAAGRAYYVVAPTPTNQTLTVRAFDLNTFTPVGDLTLSGVNATAGGLVRWGTNGLALRTTGGQLFLIQTSLIPSADPTPTPTPTPEATPTPTPESFATSVRQIPFRTKDLVYNPSTQVIHASVPSSVGAGGNSVAAINPSAATVGAPVFVGSEPNRLALSDDGQTLYVGLDGSKAVRRFDVPTQTPNVQFSLGSENFAGPFFASDLEVMPGSPGTVAVARNNFSSTSIAVYDNGVKRANDSNGAGTDIEFASPTRIYSNISCCGFGIQRHAVSASGVAFESSASPARGGGSLEYAGGLLYTSSGAVIEPETGTLKGTFAVGSVGSNTLMEVDAALGRAYFLTIPSGLTAQLSVFDVNTFLPLGRLTINNIGFTQNPDGFQISSLVRWGENGLAFRTTTHVMLIQSALVGPSGAVPDPTPTPEETPTPQPTPQSPTFVRQFDLPVNDFAYSAATQKVYAALPSAAGASGNSIVEVDPATGASGQPVFVGSEPRTLAISDDGQVVWARLEGAQAVRRFDVATKTAGLQFAIPNTQVRDLEVMPGSPETLAVATGGAPLVYDSGVQRPPAPVVPFISAGQIEFSSDPTVLYGFNNGDTGFDFFRMRVTASGVTREATARGLVGGGFAGGIEYAAGRMYARSGEVFDPDTFTPIGAYKGAGTFTAVAVDTTLRRVFFVAEDGAGMVLRAYDMDTFLPLGQTTLPFGGTPTRLARWGANGLALHAFSIGSGDTQRRLYLIQSALVSAAAPVPTGVMLAGGAASVFESNGSITLNVVRTGDLSVASSVDYETADGTASERSDYMTARGTLRFAPGESSKTVRVFLTNDAFVEGGETFEVRISAASGAQLSSPAVTTVTLFDDDFNANAPNPINSSQFFVRQHYLDFLNRQPDSSGLAFWTNEIEQCGANAQCREVKRINVSAAFFLSIEFQETGFLVYLLHQLAFGTGETLGMRTFLRDTQEIGAGVVVGQGLWEQQLAANKRDFLARFVARPEFVAAFPETLTPAQYVDALNARSADPAPVGALTQGERDQLVAELSAGTKTRADVLRAVAENAVFKRRHINRAFVYMQYVGYLRRNPNATPDTDYTGYNFWLGKLEEFQGNYVRAEMVKAFLDSAEYRHRFGQ